MSRLDEIIAAVEKGERVDWRKYNLLIALDAAKASEEFLKDRLREHSEADERITEFDASGS